MTAFGAKRMLGRQGRMTAFRVKRTFPFPITLPRLKWEADQLLVYLLMSCSAFGQTIAVYLVIGALYGRYLGYHWAPLACRSFRGRHR
jgi:hypothetical protein